MTSASAAASRFFRPERARLGREAGIRPAAAARRGRPGVSALRFVIGHLGYPWVDETIVLLGKHRTRTRHRGLLRQPWMAYNALLAAHSYGVMEKLCSGATSRTAARRRASRRCTRSTSSRRVRACRWLPREQLRGIVERDPCRCWNRVAERTRIEPAVPRGRVRRPDPSIGAECQRLGFPGLRLAGTAAILARRACCLRRVERGKVQLTSYQGRVLS